MLVVLVQRLVHLEKRKVDNNEVIIFKNAIELERFVDVDINLVKSLRKELGIDSNKKMVHHHFLW